MSNAKHIGRIGALAVALGLGFAVAATPAAGYAEPTDSAPTAPCTRTDVTCALIMGTSGVPTPDDFYVESVKNQFIAPTHPDQHIGYDAVTTPEGMWPLAGFGRLVSLLGIGASPEIFGLGGPGWDVPWWNLTGLFDLTLNQSILQGVTDLEQAMAAHPNDHLVIYGYSQSALIANRVKQRLAEQYPAGTTAPDIDFVLSGDPNLPNGGFFARFPALYIPILDWSLNGPAPTDTQFDTVEITRQYDFMADFPLYPLNGISLLNAALGFFYVHTYPFDVSLAPDPTTPRPIHSKTGDTDYYFFPTEDLPLFGPLRTLGVPEPVIDVVEPFFKVIVELGYDRTIKPWEPTPARLIPTLDPVTVAGDLVDAVGEGINNAAALIGAAPLHLPAAPVTADRNAAVQQVFSAPTITVKGIGRDVTDGVAQVLNGVGSLLPKPPALTREGLGASQSKVGRVLAGTRDQIQQSIGAVKSVFGNGRTSVRFADGDNGFTVGSAGPARKTPVRDAVNTAIHNLKKTLSGGRADTNYTADRGQGGAQ